MRSRELMTRCARVGTEGKLGGQAVVKGVAGTWKDLTDSVNSMASNLTNQVHEKYRRGYYRCGDWGSFAQDHGRSAWRDLGARTPSIRWWISASSFASEVTRVAREVGTEGKLGGSRRNVRWRGKHLKDAADSVNSMASNLTSQVRNIAGYDCGCERRFVAQDYGRCAR